MKCLCGMLYYLCITCYSYNQSINSLSVVCAFDKSTFSTQCHLGGLSYWTGVTSFYWLSSPRSHLLETISGLFCIYCAMIGYDAQIIHSFIIKTIHVSVARVGMLSIIVLLGGKPPLAVDVF